MLKQLFLYRSGKSVITESLIWLVLSLCVSIFSVFIGEEYSVAVHNTLTSMNFFSYIFIIVNWLRRNNRAISIFCLFVLYSMFSGIGQSLLYMFDCPEELLSSYNDVMFCRIIDMLKFQLLCTATLNLGVCFYLRNNDKCLSLKKVQEDFEKKESQSGGFLIENALLHVSLFYMLLIAINVVVKRQTMTYAEMADEKLFADFPFAEIFDFLASFLSIKFLLKKRKVNYIFIMYIFLISAFFSAGTRTQGIKYFGILMCFLPILKPSLFQKKYYPIWGIISVAFFIVVGLISTLRTSKLGDSSGLDFAFGMSILNTISEMGLSERPINIVIDARYAGLLPYYQTILYNIIANLFTNPVTYLLCLGSAEGIRISEFVTTYINSYWSGLGSSFIAESYVNFGWYGCFYTMFYGYFIAFAENESFHMVNKGKYVLSTIFLLILSKQIFYARAEIALIGGTLRYCTIIGLFYYLLNKRK